MALAAARLARRPGDLVARAQLAAAHLGGGDVDVVVGRREALEAQEAVALAGQLEHAADLLGRPRVAGRSSPSSAPIGPSSTGSSSASSSTVASTTTSSSVSASSGARAGVRARSAGRAGAGLGEPLDQLLAAQQPVAVDPGGGRPLVQVGQMKVLELRRPSAPQANEALRGRRR